VAGGLAVRILYRKLEVNTVLAWIVLLVGAPVAGPVLYLLFGAHSLGRRRLILGGRIRGYYQKAYAVAGADSVRLDSIAEPFGALARSITRESGFPVLARNRHIFLTDAGEILDRMRRDIDAARTECCLEFYIIDPKGRVAAVLEAVHRAALRGVACKILADDFGSKAFFGSPWPARLRAAGVCVVRSLPLNLINSLSKRSDLRNHRKILIRDRTVVYTGSCNLVDPRLFKSSSHVGEWVDVMMRIEGEMADALACVFNADDLLETPGADIDGATLRALPVERQEEPLPGAGPRMQLLPSGPEMATSTIYAFIVAAIFNARRRVRIVTPYFIPDQAVLLALTSSAERGVDVQIVVPETLDTRIGQYASQASYADLLAAGVSIVRYEGGLLHTKAMLIDEDISLFGTVNMDPRSFYLNLELSLIIYEAAINAELGALIDTYVARGAVVDEAAWAARGPSRRFLENLCRLAGPLL
jgi:cardiolipin synthase